MTLRRPLAFDAAAMVAVAAFAGCSSDSVKIGKDGKNVTVKEGNDSVTIGSAKLPKDFPKADVPLPDGGKLNAVIKGERDGKKFFSLTYTLDGDTSVKQAANDYKNELKDAGYTIVSSSSVGGSKASVGSFTAQNDDWKVIVYRGGVTGQSGALSIQVLPRPASSTTTTT